MEGCRRPRKQTILFFLFHPIISEGHRGTTDDLAASIPFHLILFSAALAEMAFLPTFYCCHSFHLFFCLPLFFLFPFTVPCRIFFSKPGSHKQEANRKLQISFPIHENGRKQETAVGKWCQKYVMLTSMRRDRRSYDVILAPFAHWEVYPNTPKGPCFFLKK